MEKIIIQNLKCSGCSNTIQKGLGEIKGLSELTIDVENSLVQFSIKEQSNLIAVKNKLNELGYPPIDFENGLAKKAKSYVSCAIGRIS